MVAATGANQHFVPQLLLKGFTKPNQPKMTYRYKKAEETRQRSIKTIASEEHFYGFDAEDNSIDKRISEFENRQLAPLIQNLRQSENTGAISVPRHQISDAAAHLWVRSGNIRDVFSNNLLTGFETIISPLAEPGFLLKIIQGLGSQSSETQFYQELVKTLPNSLDFPESLDEALKELLAETDEVQDVFLDEKNRSKITAAYSMIAKAFHVWMLKSQGIRDPHFFSGYNWFLVEDIESRIVFPDCVLLHYAPLKGFSPFIINIDRNQNIFLPLSPSRILAGSRNNECPQISDHHFSQIGRCAFDFFIHPQKQPFLEEEKGRILQIYEEFSKRVTQKAIEPFTEVLGEDKNV